MEPAKAGLPTPPTLPKFPACLPLGGCPEATAWLGPAWASDPGHRRGLGLPRLGPAGLSSQGHPPSGALSGNYVLFATMTPLVIVILPVSFPFA